MLHSTRVPSQGGDFHHVREPSIGLKSILTSPSLEKLGWEEKLLPLEIAVLAKSLTS